MRFLAEIRLFLKVVTPILLAGLTGWILLGVIVPARAVEIYPTHPYLHPTLAKALLTTSAEEYLPIVIEWPRTPEILQAIPTGNKFSQREQVIANLQNTTREQTASVMAFLQSQEAMQQAKNPRAFWISPVITLQARPALIQALTQRTDITTIRLDEAMSLEPITYTQAEVSNPLQPAEMLWNLETVHVGLTQQALGLDGTGVVVANLDTGVDWMHPALMSHYRGYRPGGMSIHYGNWHVSTNEVYAYPGDGNGHGTHTMGTILGDDGQGMRTGVAPGAKWIAVKMFTNSGVTYESWVHDAFEWIIAPEGDPALAPDVVNNSWGSILTDDERYRPDIQALEAAGILPLFSSGNSGPGMGTVGTPAGYSESFSVGAVDQVLNVASFSSRGPSGWGEVKPEVVAPGVDILSTFPGGGYMYGDGTSMAVPHVAGIIALLLQADPTLSPAELNDYLRYTTTPIGSPIPNYDSGWGLVDSYLAALQVSTHGQLSGQVLRAEGGVIVQPTLVASPLLGGLPANIQGDDTGAFSIFLAPGLYDVTASAFGFTPETLTAVQILTDTETEISFSLEELPHGAIFGEVVDAPSGQPLSATLNVEGTPISVQTNPNTGAYSLALPAGTWEFEIRADAHRVGHETVTVEANQGLQFDVALDPAPRILLIDSGRWYYGSKAAYFEDALTELDYFYHLHEVYDPFGRTGPSDNPTLEELATYDVVIWSAPLDSPGVIQAGDTITGYLNLGGKLLLSGQDVAFWDAGGNLSVAPVYFPDFLGAKFEAEGLLDPLTGLANSPLDGLEITLNTLDSDNQQYHPDEVEIQNPLLSIPSLAWPGDEVGGLVAGGCNAYRAAWTGFGLEGAGSRETRIETLARLLDWFEQPPPEFGVLGMGPENALIGNPGEVISDVIQIANTGSQTDTYDLQLVSSWPVILQTPDGNPVPDGGLITIPGCSNLTLTATLTVPDALPRDMFAPFTVTLTSQTASAIQTEIPVQAKTPAPILIMNDWRWQDYGDEYAASLSTLDLSFDLVTLNGKNLENSQILNRYDLILWTTSMDWASPLTVDETERLSAYLHRGGRLLLTSQELVEHVGTTLFVRKDLGVLRYTYHTTPTQILSSPGSPLGNMGLWNLTYAYQNWSDHLYPAQDATSLLFDEKLGTVAIAHGEDNFRTAFFSFPLETLDAEARTTLLGRTLLWLSPLGESHLSLPPTTAEGTVFPITLTIGSATTETLNNVNATLPLLSQMTLEPGSLIGGWEYDPLLNQLTWTGDLTPGQKVFLHAEFQLDSNIPDGTILPLRAYLDAGNQMILTSNAQVGVDIPWLVADMQVNPGTVRPGQNADFSLQLQNIGALTATLRLTDTLPTALTLLTSSLQTTSGDILAHWGWIEWNGIIPPGASVWISYTQTAGFWNPIQPQSPWVEIEAPYQFLGAWVPIWMEGQVYFPWIGNP